MKRLLAAIGIYIIMQFCFFVALAFAAYGTPYAEWSMFIAAFNPFSEHFRIGILLLSLLPIGVGFPFAYMLSDILVGIRREDENKLC